MPKAWNEKEKELVKATLIEEGRNLFEKFGVQKTTVDEIVKASQISKGAFYFFYETKEALYLDVLDNAQHEFREKLFTNVFQDGVSRRESLKHFFYKMIRLISTMPIYTQLNPSLFEYLSRKLPEDVLTQKLRREPEDTNRFLSQWMEHGWIKHVDLKALEGMFLEFVLFVKRKDELNKQNFEAIKELWVEMLSSYLAIEEN
jgi:AcrR family transcriptional regulator